MPQNSLIIALLPAVLLFLISMDKISAVDGTERMERRMFDQCVFLRDECPNELIRFWLYTNDTEPQSLTSDLLPAQLFTVKHPIKILIHGYTGHRNDSPNAELRQILLEQQNAYVITVDYSAVALAPCYYPWTVFNARVVARCLAQLIDSLMFNELYQPKDIHLIGFSVGAQIAGLTANYVKRKLKRITGLDPARPGFVMATAEGKLDSSDADFVDVIHTDPFMLGLLNPSGHADFYPNIQNFNQRGCNYATLGHERNCNHFRAPLYYAESITTDRGFWAYNCGSWLQFLLRRCIDYAHLPLIRMGYFVPENASGAYFLNTNAAPPYAMGPIAGLEFEIADKINVK